MDVLLLFDLNNITFNSISYYMIYKSVVVYSLYIIAPIVCVGFVLGPCIVMQYFVSFLGLQLSRERERESCLL